MTTARTLSTRCGPRPELLLLIFAAAASGLTGEWFDAGIVLTIVVATVAVGYSREYSAQVAADALRARVHVRTQVVRDGRVDTIDTRGTLPGDLVLLSAGCLVPADARIIRRRAWPVRRLRSQARHRRHQ